MKIVTVTLNPAFDLHCYADSFKPYHENIFAVTAMDAGGKGINVSRALMAVGAKSRAVCVVGRENGAEFIERLSEQGLSVVPVYAEGRIRENITLHERSKPETRISFQGFSASEELLAEVRTAVGALSAGDVCVFAGSAPKGISEEALVSFLFLLKANGARLVIDSRSVSLGAMQRLRPFLIKPNKEEAEGALGISIESLADAKRAAEALQAQGIENVLLSLGAEGAVLATDAEALYANAPRITPLSTIGAGDSTLAGYLSALVAENPPRECLARAIAFGSAACLSEGTAPPRLEDAMRLLSEVKVEKL